MKAHTFLLVCIAACGGPGLPPAGAPNAQRDHATDANVDMPAEGHRDPPVSRADRVAIPAGTFRMGSPSNQLGRDVDEGPATTIAIEAFAMDRTPVTAAAFEARMGDVTAQDDGAWYLNEGNTPSAWLGQCNLGSTREDHPMNCLDWRAGAAYCAAVGGRLPTEAEWEYAARAGTSTPYWWGEVFNGDHAVNSFVCGTRGCREATESVVTEGERCNAWGLCDMAGNVWQWTSTEYEPELSAAANTSSDAPYRPVHRGASWLDSEERLFRSAMRGLNYPDHGMTGVGFRCVYPPADAN